MKKHKPASRKVRRIGTTNWLPVDDRLIPHIFSFGSVKGIARVFLQVEIILSVGVVFGALILFILQLVY